MKTFMRFLSHTFLFLFTLGFIFPAVLFSVLVIGFTDTWQPGLTMLGTAVVLLLFIRLIASDRIVVYSKSKKTSRIVYESWTDHEAPPPLMDIDNEIAGLNREHELFIDELLSDSLNERARRYSPGSGPRIRK